MEEHPPDLFEQLWDFLSQILLPAWGDLIAFIPLIFIGLVVLFLLGIALMWRRAGARTRPRVPTRLASGSPPPGVHMPGPSKWPFVAPIGVALVLFGVILDMSPLLIGLGLAVSAVAILGWLRDAMGEWRTAEVGHHGAAGAAAGAAWAEAHGTPRRMGGGAAVAALPAGHAPLVEPASWEIEPPPGVHMPGPSPWPFFAPIAIALVLFGLILSVWLLIGGLVLALVAIGGWLRDASKEWRSTERVGHAVPETRDPQQAWPRRMVPLFVTVIALSIGLALLPLGLAWLGSLAPGPAQPTPVVVPERPEIAAFNSTSFDRRELIVPAGRDFVLVFHNAEVGVPHNVDIADDSARNTLYFEGEIFNGDETVEYNVPALDEGDYYFFCRVHPNMNGTVLARPETGSPGGESPSP
jgi:plastocyanin